MGIQLIIELESNPEFQLNHLLRGAKPETSESCPFSSGNKIEKCPTEQVSFNGFQSKRVECNT